MHLPYDSVLLSLNNELESVTTQKINQKKTKQNQNQNFFAVEIWKIHEARQTYFTMKYIFLEKKNFITF